MRHKWQRRKEYSGAQTRPEELQATAKKCLNGSPEGFTGSGGGGGADQAVRLHSPCPGRETTHYQSGWVATSVMPSTAPIVSPMTAPHPINGMQHHLAKVSSPHPPRKQSPSPNLQPPTSNLQLQLVPYICTWIPAQCQPACTKASLL